MTPTQKRLRDLRERQSKERGRLAELSLVDELNDEQRGELDNLEKGTPDLERQLRAATVALEDEEREAETRAVNDPDTEQRERIELRSKAQLTNFLMSAARGRMVDGAEAELQAAAGVSGHGIPLELWDVPTEQRGAEGERETRAITPAPGTVGVNLDPIRPAVFANPISAGSSCATVRSPGPSSGSTSGSRRPASSLEHYPTRMDQFDGGKSACPGRRGAKRDAGTSGEGRNEPGMPIYPTEGRVLLRRGVARASLPMSHIAMRSAPSHGAD